MYSRCLFMPVHTHIFAFADRLNELENSVTNMMIGVNTMLSDMTADLILLDAPEFLFLILLYSLQCSRIRSLSVLSVLPK